ncbi:MAG TPA: toast rack family protein [Anaerolineales bacterium]|nr:toast rack family protein [Anaerolineales bacterium]
MNKKIIPLALIITLLISGCGVTFQLPQVTPGPVAYEKIEATAPGGSSDPIRLKLTFGAGEMLIRPGSDILISGQASFNIPDFKPEITSTDNVVNVTQGSYTLNKIPNFSNVVNTWDLELGNNPIDLEISAGAYSATMELGRLALTNVMIKDGASDVHLSFSEKNLSAMNLFRYETGASQVILSGLANADFSLLEFTGGAGNYTLDFSGEFSRDATASITAGLGNLRIVIPQNVHTQLTIDGNFSNITIDDHWIKNGSTYTQEGSGPMLTIIVKAGAANLVIAGE